MKNNRSTYAVKKEVRSGVGFRLRSLLISLGISVAVFAFLIFISALYSSSLDDPEKYLLPLGLFSLFAGALCAGFSGVKLSGGGVVIGICCGLVYSVMAALVRLIAFGGVGVGLLPSLGIYLGLVGVSFLGAVIGNYRPDPVKKRKSKIKKFTD